MSAGFGEATVIAADEGGAVAVNERWTSAGDWVELQVYPDVDAPSTSVCLTSAEARRLVDAIRLTLEGGDGAV